MVNGVEPAAAKAGCESPVEKNVALSRKYRINGTPTLVFADGQRVAGYMTAPKLTKMLDETSRK
jgi:thiol:disulfide interchange protein DsbC